MRSGLIGQSTEDFQYDKDRIAQANIFPMQMYLFYNDVRTMGPAPSSSKNIPRLG